MCAGGVTSLAAAGVPPVQIQAIGRWKSDTLPINLSLNYLFYFSLPSLPFNTFSVFPAASSCTCLGVFSTFAQCHPEVDHSASLLLASHPGAPDSLVQLAATTFHDELTGLQFTTCVFVDSIIISLLTFLYHSCGRNFSAACLQQMGFK